MKTFRAKTGPFFERPHFELTEIERICSEALRKVDLLSKDPAPIRIDRFIEKRFGVAHTYDELPPGVLGYTRFGSSGVEEIVVASSLDQEDVEATRRRLRSTLAHEAGHGLLHAHLFALGERPQLFPVEGRGKESDILCRDDAVAAGPDKNYDGRWWEYQANRAIGGLLLPRPLVIEAVRPLLETKGSLGAETLPPHRTGEAERALATIFDVNPVVARIRLAELFPSQTDRQMAL